MNNNIKATFSYYSRSFVWVGFIYALLQGLETVPNKTISALKGVILFSILLFGLAYLKIRKPSYFENLRWFCAPGNIFLKSWISLMFYVYLICAPAQLAQFSGPNIFSWVVQVVIGNFVALCIGAIIIYGAMMLPISMYTHIPDEIDDRGSGIERLSLDVERNPMQSTGNMEVEAVSKDRGSLSSARSSFSQTIMNKRFSVMPIAQNFKKYDKMIEKAVLDAALASVAETERETFSGFNDFHISHGVSAAALQSSTTTTTTTTPTIENGGAVTFQPGDESSFEEEPRESFSVTPANVVGRDMQRAAQRMKKHEVIARLNHQQFGGAGNNFRAHPSLIAMSLMRQSPAPSIPRSGSGTVLAASPEDSSSSSSSSSSSKNNSGSNITTSPEDPSTLPPSPPSSPKSNKVEEGSATSGVMEDVKPTAVEVPAVPFVPTMYQLLKFWFGIATLTALILFISPSKSQSSVISFQLSITYVVFICSSTYRMHFMGGAPAIVQSVMQPVVLFVPIMVFFVVFSSGLGYQSWVMSLEHYIGQSQSLADINNWGAGDFVATFLSTAFVSLAFASVDTLIEHYRILIVLIPAMWLVCLIIMMQIAGISSALATPEPLARALITKCTTTPVAISLSGLLNGPPSLVAASSVLNTVVAYRTAPYILNLIKATNPAVRGICTALSGTLLGVVGLGENHEDIACGIGMAAYAIGTILYAISVAIVGFRDFEISHA